jgi:histidyl-tRNA synthetase
MSKLSTDPYKGVQDFYPDDMAIERYIFSVWSKTAEEFGYKEYNASPLELTELYTEKSGEEIVKEQTFTFTDRGGRSVTLRPEMTPTLARMVAAKRKELKFPLRWFSIPNLFRYEKPQRGRRREHYQFNADILGVTDINADVEIVNIAYKILKNFGATENDFVIKLNHAKGNMSEVEKFQAELAQKGITNTKVDESLARGQTYYTGLVFEIFDTDEKNGRSIFGGGRYDNLLELFEVEPVPAVGIACGDIVIRDFLETHGLRTHA